MTAGGEDHLTLDKQQRDGSDALIGAAGHLFDSRLQFGSMTLLQAVKGGDAVSRWHAPDTTYGYRARRTGTQLIDWRRRSTLGRHGGHRWEGLSHRTCACRIHNENRRSIGHRRGRQRRAVIQAGKQSLHQPQRDDPEDGDDRQIPDDHEALAARSSGGRGGARRTRIRSGGEAHRFEEGHDIGTLDMMRDGQVNRKRRGRGSPTSGGGPNAGRLRSPAGTATKRPAAGP